MFHKLFGPSAKSALVESAFEEFSAMLKQAADMYDLATAALFDNVPLEADLDAMDDRIDEGERNIRRMMLEHLAVNPEQQLVASLALLSIVQDAERLGDFARGLGELIDLARSSRDDAFAADLRALAERIRPQFDACREGFRDENSEVTRAVGAKHIRIKQELIEFTERLAGSDLKADLVVVYASGARILRRISAHLANIASAVTQPFDRIRHGDEDA